MTSVQGGARWSEGWPEKPKGLEQKDYDAKLLDAQLKEIGDRLIADHQYAVDNQSVRDKATADLLAAHRGTDRDADIANLGRYYDHIATLAIGAVDRTRASAELVQKASAAIASLYTAVLALVFSVSDNPLPARGVVAPIFLGVAVVLSTAYLAYLKAPGHVDNFFPEPRPSMTTRAYEQIRKIIETSSRIALRRTRTLRRSVVALGVGLAAITLPFLGFSVVVPATETPTPWPSQPTSGNVDLNKIQFTAQVAEVAKKREAQSKASIVDRYDSGMLIGGLIVGALLVIIIPVVDRCWSEKE